RCARPSSRGREEASAVIASEAKQSSLAAEKKAGLLRRGACHRARVRATRWLLAMTSKTVCKEGTTMFATTLKQPDLSPVAQRPKAEDGAFHLAIIAGFACACLLAKAAPLTSDLVAAVIEPLCMTSASAASSENVVEPIASHALPNVAGKRVTVVRVFYGPGGSTPPHYHSGSVTPYITKGEIRSQLRRGPVQTFKAGQSFFDPPRPPP